MPKPIEIAAKLYETGKLDEADSVCCRILDNDKHNVTALNLRGVIAYQSKNYSAAVTLLSAANKLIKNDITIMFALAASHENIQQYEAAIQLYRNICYLNPANTAARQQLAGILEKTHQTKEALSEYQILNDSIGNNAPVLLALSRIYAGSGLVQESKKYAQKLLDLKPENPDIWNNLGIVYKTLGCTDNAIGCFKTALSINANHIKSRLNLASLLQDSGIFDDAKKHYLEIIQAVKINQSELSRAYYNLALIYLGEGDFSRGWELLTHRPKKFSDTPSIANIKNKRLLILGEEGIGDELTFLRFIPLLKDLGARINYIGNPKLLPLLEHVDCIDNLHDSIPPVEKFDYCISAMDLPFILKSDDISKSSPLQLKPIDNQSNSIIEHLKKSNNLPVLGITWQAGKTEDAQNQEKYLSKKIPLEKLCTILKTFTGTIVILQRNPKSSEIEFLTKHLKNEIIDASSLNNDLNLMLLLLSKINHYLGVSNTNMHLFGSLGGRCDVIVPFPGEWRWMREGNSSPWYPEFNVIRQTNLNNWNNISNIKPNFA